MSVTHISLGRKMRASPQSPRGDNRQDSIKDQFCFKHIRGRRSGCVHCWLLERDKRTWDSTISHAIQNTPVATTGYVHSSRCQISASIVDSTSDEAVLKDEIRSCRAFPAQTPEGLLDGGATKRSACLSASAQRRASGARSKTGWRSHFKEVVEPDGIEPTTSSLQS